MNQLSRIQAATLLQFKRLPARLNSLQAGVLLGFSPYDLTVLASEKLIRPLGKPSQNSTKYYAASLIVELAGDLNWLNKATQSVQAHWRAKNGSRNPSSSEPQSESA